MIVKASPDSSPRGSASTPVTAAKALQFFWRWSTEAIVATLTAIMVLTIMLQVFCRFVLGNPLSWSEELARYAFVWITFLGAAVAYRHGAHIVVDTVIVCLPRRVQAVLGWVVDGLIVIALLTLVVQGVGIVEVNSSVEATMLEIPMSWVYASVPVSAALMLAYQVERTVQRIRAGREFAASQGKRDIA